MCSTATTECLGRRRHCARHLIHTGLGRFRLRNRIGTRVLAGLRDRGEEVQGMFGWRGGIYTTLTPTLVVSKYSNDRKCLFRKALHFGVGVV